MPRTALKKEKWTLTFDQFLKNRIQQEARKMHVYPVQLLESLVRERLNPYGFQSVENSLQYITSVRKKSALKNDRRFLAEMKKWEKR